jgi:hypothetical protein
MKALNETGCGYKIKRPTAETHTICHLLHTDDLQVYAETPRQHSQLIDIVKLFTKDIQMEIGLDKCLMRGNVEPDGVETRQGDMIEPMKEIDTYKYLGILHSRQIQYIKIKKQLTTPMTSRLRKILKTYINSKNLIKATNTCVILLLTYSSGMITLSQTY